VARALIDDPTMLFCDEATANIDLNADERLHNLILSLGDKTTVLWIMHRLHFIELFDRVLIFENGVLVENGAPREMVEDKSSRLVALMKEANLLDQEG